MPKVEMIIEYTTDGADYQYNDNHGVLTRCKDCVHWEKQEKSLQGRCELLQSYPTGQWYCGNAEKR